MNTTTKYIVGIILIAVFLAGYFFMQASQGAQAAPAARATAQSNPASQTAQGAQAIQLESYATDGFSGAGAQATGATPVTAASPEPAAATSVNEKKITSATLHTNMGDVQIVFNPATPLTTANFLKLAQSGFYDGTKFHRVIKGFMSQGGDPFSKDDAKADMWGRGGPGYAFADEITAGNSNDTNTVAMANAGPNTNGSQFFINAAPNHSLDSKHTVFARVIQGQDIVAAINAVATGPNDRPVKPVVITSISLQ